MVTGASVGMGAATARELARRGFHVLAGVRRAADGDAIRDTHIEPVIIDITDPAQIENLARRFQGTLRALVNNAGVAANGPVETLPLSEWRRSFEVNLFGHVAVTQAFLPMLLRSKGRIINISSIGGKVAMASYGAYAGSKFALEAMSDALRRELAPHGVQVVVVEPGGVQTEMSERGIATANRLTAAMTPDQLERYAPMMQAIVAHTRAFTNSGVSADRAARTIADAVTARRPRIRYTIGRDAAAMTRLTRILPDRLLDRVVAANLRPHFPSHT